MFNLKNLCFLCLTYNNNDSNRNCNYVKVQEELKYIIPTDVLQKPEVPKYICVSCVENLNNITKFRKMCLQNVVIFNEYVQKLTQEFDPCNESISFSQPEKYQMLNEIDNNTNNLHEKSKDVRNIKKEVTETNNIELKENRLDEMREDIDIEEVYVKNENGIEDICVPSEMDKEFVIKEENMEENCTGREYIHRHQYSNSKNIQSEDNQLESPRVTSNHTEESLYARGVCQKAFGQTDTLRIHESIHNDKKPFECDVCKKTFTLKHNLIRHELIHTDKKPYKCDVCEKAFSQKTSLNHHKNIHTGEKPFKCDVCERTFIQKSNLIQHKNIHTGEKSYKCDVCQKTFSQKTSLVRHKHIHTRI